METTQYQPVKTNLILDVLESTRARFSRADKALTKLAVELFAAQCRLHHVEEQDRAAREILDMAERRGAYLFYMARARYGAAETARAIAHTEHDRLEKKYAAASARAQYFLIIDNCLSDFIDTLEK
jgi:CRP-like cAMP-binding protein